ncbi:oxidoreductase [Paenibacillus sp. DMB20]|nr:oxidoreductase [Paenibacillus sp. DMB20]
MQNIKIGIVGTGFGAEVHAPIFSLHPGFEVRGIASVHRGIRKRSFKSLDGLAVYDDWIRLLNDEELDLITIASAPMLHSEMALTAIRKGLHVLCEKPLGMNADETSMMLKELGEKGVHGYVNFQWRMLPIRRKIKQIIENGELGAVRHIKYQGSFSANQQLQNQYRGWEGKKESGGGFLFAVGSHMLDSLMWWTGGTIAQVYADLRTWVPFFKGSQGEEARDADDAFSIMGHFESGASFIVDFLAPGVNGTGWNLEIYGTRGTLVMKNDRTLEIGFGEGFKEILLEQIEPPSQLDIPAKLYYSGFYPMIDFIHQSITTGESIPIIPTFEDGHRVQTVLDAIFESAEKQARVTVNYANPC